MRLVSAGMLAANLATVAREQRDGPAWPGQASRRRAIGASLLANVFWAASIIVARVGMLQVMFLVQLIDPVSILVNTVRDLGRPGSDEGG